MKKLISFGAALLTALALAGASSAQTAAGQSQTGTNGGAVDVARIIRAFTAKETEFRRRA